MTAERVTEKHNYSFPKLGLTPRERTILGDNLVIAKEQSHTQAIDAATNLFAYSLAKATGMDAAWETGFSQEVTTTPNNSLVQTLLTSEPAVSLGSPKLRDIESNLRVTKSMVTAVDSLDLLLRLRLGIKSKHAIKREVKDKARERYGRFSRKQYYTTLNMLNRRRISNESDEFYEQWRQELRQKSDRTHQAYLSFREELNSQKKMEGR